jgi:glycosyltransferase involved in cell wall biosynthesis
MSAAGKRVLFLINSFAVGGAERVFVTDMLALRSKGWDVHAAVLFSRGALARELEAAEVPVHELHLRSVYDVPGVLRLRRLVQELSPDAVLSSLNEANAVMRIARLFGARARLITREANMADAKGVKYKLGDIFFGWLSSTIVVVSKAVGDSVCAYAPWLRSRMVVLYNGVAIPPHVAYRPRSSHEFYRLITVGSLTDKKDHAILLQAMSMLPDAVHLTIIGGGPLEAELQALCEKLGLSQRVVFLGSVSHARVHEELRAHDAFVLPSKREGCPNVVSEAQAEKLPVVAFAIPGMDEFVSPENGVLVARRSAAALAAAILQLSSDLDRAQRLGMHGYAAVSKRRTLDAHIQALASLLAPAVH